MRPELLQNIIVITQDAAIVPVYDMRPANEMIRGDRQPSLDTLRPKDVAVFSLQPAVLDGKIPFVPIGDTLMSVEELLVECTSRKIFPVLEVDTVKLQSKHLSNSINAYYSLLVNARNILIAQAPDGHLIATPHARTFAMMKRLWTNIDRDDQPRVAFVRGIPLDRHPETEIKPHAGNSERHRVHILAYRLGNTPAEQERAVSLLKPAIKRTRVQYDIKHQMVFLPRP